MTARVNESTRHENLRLKAAALLAAGSAPRTRSASPEFETLKLLYRLASDPSSAVDALRLLNELQVHQVELDLQREQLEDNDRESAQQLARYTALFLCAPVGYLVLGLAGQVLDSNEESARLLGVEHTEIGGRALDRLVDPGSRQTLADLMTRLREGADRAYCQVRVRDGGESSPTLHVAARVAPSAEAILMTLADPGAVVSG
jgi:PAS domain S-box-containing protein